MQKQLITNRTNILQANEVDIMNDKEMQQAIKNLEEKVKRLEKSNRNWRRKCQRLRNKKDKVQWFSEMIKPEEHKRVVVRDENGKEYRNHEWVGHAWYSFSGCDGWITDVDVVSWRYQQNQSSIGGIKY